MSGYFGNQLKEYAGQQAGSAISNYMNQSQAPTQAPMQGSGGMGIQGGTGNMVQDTALNMGMPPAPSYGQQGGGMGVQGLQGFGATGGSAPAMGPVQSMTPQSNVPAPAQAPQVTLPPASMLESLDKGMGGGEGASAGLGSGGGEGDGGSGILGGLLKMVFGGM